MTSQKICFLNPTSVDVCARFVGPDLGNLSADIISCREKDRVDHGSIYKVRV